MTTEFEKFLASTGMTPSEVAAHFARIPVLQGEPLPASLARRGLCISFFGDAPSSSNMRRRQGNVEQIMTELEPPPCSDISLPSPEFIARRYLSRKGDLVAAEDALGNVYVCDFYHEATPYDLLPLARYCTRPTEIDVVAGTAEYAALVPKTFLREVVISHLDDSIVQELAAQMHVWAEPVLSARIEALKQQYEGRLRVLENERVNLLAIQNRDARLFGILGRLGEQGWQLTRNGELTIRITITRLTSGNVVKSIPCDKQPIVALTVKGNQYKTTPDHPHIDKNTNRPCWGSLANLGELDRLTRAVEVLSTVNLDSAYGCELTARLKALWSELKERGDEVFDV